MNITSFKRPQGESSNVSFTHRYRLIRRYHIALARRRRLRGGPGANTHRGGFMSSRTRRPQIPYWFTTRPHEQPELLEQRPAGGTGAGTGGDPLGSQGSLTLGSQGSFSPSMPAAAMSRCLRSGHDLVLLDGSPPAARCSERCRQREIHVYVVNAGGTPNIQRFIIDPIGGHLIPLPSSQRRLRGHACHARGISASTRTASVLLVTEKGTKLIDTYRVDSGDTPQGRYRTPPAA